jgi:hypothetical protein
MRFIIFLPNALVALALAPEFCLLCCYFHRRNKRPPMTNATKTNSPAKRPRFLNLLAIASGDIADA